MKEKAKLHIIISIVIIILFIPTFIALSSYYSNEEINFDLQISDEVQNNVDVPPREINSTVSLILKLKEKLIPVKDNTTLLPSKYYHVAVKENGNVITSMRWYLVAEKNQDSFVEDENGNLYILKYKHAKKFLSKSISYHFYDTAEMPTLSVDGGDDVIPTVAAWQYRDVLGSMIYNSSITTAENILTYPMNTSPNLSFSIAPNKCTISVYSGYSIIDEFSSVEALSNIEEGLKIKIEATWNSKNYKGRAVYEFYTSAWSAPIYTFNSDTVSVGEFFTVKVTNVGSPQKIEFTSIPEIYAKPIFSENGVALIPIKKELAAPCNYIFSFKYGENVQSFSVNVEERSVRNDKVCDTDRVITESEKLRINELFCSIASQSQEVCLFDDGFLDYSPENGAKLAEVFYGFGHTVIPLSGADQFRLNGVIYIFPNNADIPAVCKGTIINKGIDELLGQYVTVDHGMGLMTWYCGLNEIYLSVGDSIDRGDSVGNSGNTGFDGINGVYLITTVGGIPVSPYPLQNGDFSLLNQK